jgi:Glycosyltransferase WbsX
MNNRAFVMDSKQKKARLISFYLPQFHPILENDHWWGKGFTEWTNVSKSQAQFKGHHQPHLPADLGFYDLRLPEARIAQANMAREYGVEAFCYWHYWFHGKRLIERPFQEVLQSGEPNFPFCLAWANETWSRRWLGEEKDVLQAQTYSPEDDLNHARWLLPVFADPRCVKVNGRPLFLIYRPTDLPDPQRTTDLFRNESVRNGLPEPFLVGINAHCWNLDCRTIGFDQTLLFMPQLGNLPEFMVDEPSESKRQRNKKFGIESAKLKIYDYEEALISMLENRSKYKHPVVPSIFVGWDNTPRRSENGIIILNSKPAIFGKHLERLVQEVQVNPPDERMVFLNAWNEWAEGNHLEPDDLHGKGYLEEVRRVVYPAGTRTTNPGSDSLAVPLNNDFETAYHQFEDIIRAP